LDNWNFSRNEILQTLSSVKRNLKMFIVMTAKAKMPSSCWGKYGKIAVVEVAEGKIPKQIHPKHKAIKRIVEVWDRKNIGGPKSAFAIAKKEAEELCKQLNVN
jgi:tRNA G37 N-methylase Trm5